MNSKSNIESLSPNNIFVFGSNLAGRHGAGAALVAVRKFGAIYGQGIGLQGASYGIPTKDHVIQTLPLNRIKFYVDEFINFALMRQDLTFHVTEIGCGFAGYKPSQIAPMFRNSPNNILLPASFSRYI